MIFTVKNNLEKRIALFKVLTAISFIVIVDPLIVFGPGSNPTFIDYLTGVQIVKGIKDIFYLKGQLFDRYTIMLIGYCISFLYLLFSPVPRSRMMIVIDLIAVTILCILGIITTVVAVVTGFFRFIPSLITLVAFWSLTIVLVGLLIKKFKVLNQSVGGHVLSS
jgi:hypothetical protein